MELGERTTWHHSQSSPTLSKVAYQFPLRPSREQQPRRILSTFHQRPSQTTLNKQRVGPDVSFIYFRSLRVLCRTYPCDVFAGSDTMPLCDSMINYSRWSSSSFPLWGEKEQMMKFVPLFEILKLHFTFNRSVKGKKKY